MASSQRPSVIVILGGGFLVACVGLVVWIELTGWASENEPVRHARRSPPATAAPEATHSQLAAWVMTQDCATLRRTAPAIPQWPTLAEVGVVHNGGGRYSVAGWVDSQNSFGALIRTRFVCDLHHESGNTWRLDSLQGVE